MWMKIKYSKKIIIINLFFIFINIVFSAEKFKNEYLDTKDTKSVLEKETQENKKSIEVEILGNSLNKAAQKIPNNNKEQNIILRDLKNSSKVQKEIENSNIKAKEIQVMPQKIGIIYLYSKYISQVKDSIEIIYYIIFSIVAVVTYFSAKKTIFLPLKSEVFKYQIEELEKLYRYLQTSELISGLEKNCLLNTAKMIEDYIVLKKWNNHLIDNEEFEKELGSTIILEEYKNDEITFLKSEIKQKSEIEDWKEYKIKRILISKQFEEEEKKIKVFRGSPFLPKILLIKIEELEEEVKNINYELKEYLSEVAKQIPREIKKNDNMEDNMYTLYSQLVVKINFESKIGEKKREVQKIIRKYLNSDSIFNKNF